MLVPKRDDSLDPSGLTNDLNESPEKQLSLSLNLEAPIVVIGAGPVGIHFINSCLANRPSQKIILFGDEPHLPYDRVKLSNLLAGSAKHDSLNLRIPKNKNLEQRYDCLVTSIDPVEKKISDETGRLFEYSTLIIATGSRPHIPDIPGASHRRVYTFRDMKDTEALIARSTSSRRIVVIGGGLLGLETAKAMQRGQTHVTLVQQAPRLMNRQLDTRAASILLRSVNRLGIEVYLNSGVREILGETGSDPYGKKDVTGVRLRNGTIIDCDTVIFATGIVPNAELAFEAKLKIGRGIKVDEHLQTSVKDIYAVGECAEFNEQIYGLVGPGIEQASILSKNLTADAGLRYLGSINASSLKVVGEDVFSIGDIDTDIDRDLKSSIYEDRDSSTAQYRRIFVKNGRIVGALAIGEWPEQSLVRKAVIEGQRLSSYKFWAFSNRGYLFGENPVVDAKRWPDSALICNCKVVNKGEINDCIASGCTSVCGIGEATGAGSICGSCKPLLASLLGEEESDLDEINPKSSYMKVISILGIVLCLLTVILDPIEYSNSVQLNFSPDVLWRDGFYKQVTGFGILGVAFFGLALSLRKRVEVLKFLDFVQWRNIHTFLGVSCIGLLLLHTGFRMGENINLWLMTNFLTILLVGGLAGVIIGFDNSFGSSVQKKLRRYLALGHIVSFWPLPVLLGFHVLSVYYF